MHGICQHSSSALGEACSSSHVAAPPSPPDADLTTETIAGQLQWWSDGASERWWVETYSSGNYTLPRQPMRRSTDVGLIGMLPGQVLSIACTRPKTSMACLSMGLATKENSWTELK